MFFLRRLVQIHVLICLVQIMITVEFICKFIIYTILYVWIRKYEFLHIDLYVKYVFLWFHMYGLIIKICIQICTNLWLADKKKSYEFQKKGFPVEPRYAGICTFSTKIIETLMHAIWDTGLYDFVFVPEPSGHPVRDLRLIRIHFHAIANPFAWWVRSQYGFTLKVQ
jgi:hypothetical protein